MFLSLRSCFLGLLITFSCGMMASESVRKRSPWETTSAKDGVELVDRSELKISDDSSIFALHAFPASTLHEGSSGYTFLNWSSMAKHVTTRTPLACFGILNGFQAERCNKEGFDKARVCQIILTVKDPQAGSTQPRACTILNFASDPKQFVVKGAETCDLKLSKAQRSTIAFELRETDASKQDWSTFSDEKAFAKYTMDIAQTVNCADHIFWYAVSKREGFLSRRAVILENHRDKFYALSGQRCIQIKSLRDPTQGPEDGFDIIRLPRPDGLQLHDVWNKGHGQNGWLGAFASPFGLYLRFRDDSLSVAREAWLKGDNRFNEENRGIKTSQQWRIQGFGPGTTAPEVFEAMKSIEWLVVPIRCFQIGGLTTCMVAADGPPKHMKINTDLGVLLIEPYKAMPRNKFSQKPKPQPSKGSADRVQTQSMKAFKQDIVQSRSQGLKAQVMADPWADWKSNDLTSRVNALEKRLSGVESEQKSTREQLDGLQNSQQSNFNCLMQAIHELKGLSSASSTPITSPAAKAAKLS